MKAIRVAEFGGPEVLQMAEALAPEAGPGEVVVEVRAIGVNPVETYIRSGNYARKPALPFTPWTDAAGVIASVGKGVATLHVGQRVYTAGSVSGTYAEQARCPASAVHPLPDQVTFEQGAALGVPYATAQFALFHRGRIQPGETLLVHGASGGVGLAALQLARAAGIEVWGTAGTPAGLALIQAQGALAAFDHRAEKYLDAVLVRSGGRGVDVILEMLANQNLGGDLGLLAPGGRVVVVGSRGPVEINPRDLMGRNAEIRGVMLAGATPAELAAIHAALQSGLAAGALQPVIGRRFPLADADAAHRAILEPGAQGKIVLIP